MNPFSIPPIAMAGIAFYVGAYHLLIYLRRKQHREHLSFALTSLGVGFYDVFCAGLYSAVSTAEGARWQRAQVFTLALISVALVWFVLDYTSHIPDRHPRGARKAGWALSVYFILAALIGLVERAGLTWHVDQPAIKEIRLPFGLETIYYEVTPGPVTNLQSMVGLLLFAYIVWIGVHFYRRGHREQARPLLLSIAFLFAGVFNDIAVSSRLYQFVYLIEYAYMGVVLLMTYSLTRAVVEAAVIKDALQESEKRFRVLFEGAPDAIFLADPESGEILDANPAASRLLLRPREEIVGRHQSQVHPPRLEEPVQERFAEHVRQKGPTRPSESVVLRSDGSETPVEVLAQVIHIRGKPILQGVFRDITERKQAEEAVRRRNRELALLNRVIAAASTTLEPKAVLEITCRELALAFDVPQAAAALLNEARTASSVVAEYLAEGRPSGLGSVIPLEGNPATRYVLEHKAPLAVTDAQHDPRIAPVHDLMRRRGTVSLLILPLLVRGEVVGTIGLDAVERREFNDEEVNLAASAAAAAAQALENAHLFKAEREARQISDTLSEIGRELNAAPNLDAALDLVLSFMERVIAFDSGSVLLLEDGKMNVTAVRGFEEPEQVLNAQLDLDLALLNREVIESRRPLTVASVVDDPRWIESMEASDLLPKLAQVHSWLGVPLLIQDRVIGMVTADKVEPDFYRPQDAELAMAFAGHAAIAIEKARLLEAEQRRRQEADTLREAALALSTSLDWDQVVERILGQLQRVVPYDSASVLLLKGDRMEIVGGRGFPNLPEIVGLSFPVDGDNPNREVFQSRAPFIVEDGPAVYEEFRHEPHAPAGIRAWLGVPMLVGERLIGMIALDRREPGFYTQEHAWLAEAFAAQAAAAIENSRLFEAARRQAGELTRLHNAAVAMSSSLGPDEVLPMLAEQIGKALNVTSAYICDVDEHAMASTVLAEWVGPGATHAERESDLGVSYGLQQFPTTLRALRERQPLAVQAADPGLAPADRESSERYGWKSYLTVPLMTRDRMIGYAELWESRWERAFTPAEMQLCQTLAADAAVAIENVQLFAEIHRRTAHLEALNAIIAAAAAAAGLSELLEAVLDHTLSALGLEVGGIWVPPYAAVRGLPPEIHAAMAQAAQAAKLDISGPDVVEDWGRMRDELSALRPVMDRLGIRASLTVPVLAEGRRIGGLSLAAPEPQSWSSEEIALVEAVGRQLGGAAERLRLLEKTHKQARQVQQIMDTVPEGVVLLDASGRIILANPVAEEDLALLAGAQVGDTLTHLGERPLASLLISPPEGLWHEVELDGPPSRSFEVIARSIETGSTAGGWVLVMRDVTQERKIQRGVQQQERLAAVGQLAAGIAHDFNNLLTAINGFAELLRFELPLEDSGQELVGKILNSGRRAAGLVRQLLAFSRRQIIQPRVLNLNEVVGDVEGMLRRIIGEDIQLRTILATGLWSVKVDPTQIEQVIVNLAVNARDAMPRGGWLTIETSNVVVGEDYAAHHPPLVPGEHVLLAVSDTGVGMSQEVQAHIFEPFFTTKEVGKGTGLGLATVYGIVEQSGGHIWVTSEEGRGTTFKIHLPRAGGAARPLDRPEPGREMSSGRETILLVEDDEGVRGLARHVLHMLGYTLLEAEDGREALRLVGDHPGPIHLLLTDVVMPGMSGVALADELAGTHPDLKVLLMSGYTDETIAHHGVPEPGMPFIQKPFSPGALAHKVREVLDEGDAGESW